MAQKQSEVKQLGADAAEKQDQVNRCKQGALQQLSLRSNVLQFRSEPDLHAELSSLTNALSNAELQEQVAKLNQEVRFLSFVQHLHIFKQSNMWV